jgi:hypothetical protein
MSPTRTNPKTGGGVRPWVKDVLSNELLYRDGEPIWPDSVKKATAVSERVKVSRFLVKHAFVKPGLKCIAEKLEYCSPNNRCHCGACPECGRALQRFFVSESKLLFADQSVCVASVIDSRMSIRDELSQFSASGLINRVRSLLRRNGGGLAAGGIDFSYNQDGIGTFGSHWCAHLWLILPNRNRNLWEPALRKANPASEAVPRPIKVLNWDGRNEGVAYALKTTFKRRVSVHQNRRSSDARQRNTSEQDLRVAERIPLYQYLNSVGLHARVFLLGARPTLTDQGFSIVKLDRGNQ